MIARSKLPNISQPDLGYHFITGMYIFVVSVLFAHLCVVASCPEGCTCDDSTKRVDCTSSSLQLVRVPSDIPRDTRELRVYNQNITRIYREDFMRVPGLVTLHLPRNNIRVINQDALIDLVNLTTLWLYSNSISMIGGLTFDHLQKLEYLYLHYNPELVMTPCALAGLVSLRTLYLLGTNVTYGPGLFSGGAGCEGASYPPLEDLRIHNTPTMLVDAETLSHHPGITTLFIGAEGVELTWRSLEMLHQLTQLSIDYPSSDILHNDIPSSLGNLNQLNLYHVDDFPPSFPGHHRLQRLYIFQSSFTRLPPHAFTNVTSLEVLYITHGALAHIDRDSLRGLVNLTLLSLYINNIQTLPAGLLSDVPSSFTFHSWGLQSNPLICDCNIKWLVVFISDRGIGDGLGTCSSPAGLAGTRLNELTEDNFIDCLFTTTQSTTTMPVVSGTKSVSLGPTAAESAGASHSTVITTGDSSGGIGTGDGQDATTAVDAAPIIPSRSNSPSPTVTSEEPSANGDVNFSLVAVFGLGGSLVVAVIIIMISCLITLTTCKRLRERKRREPDATLNMINMTASNVLTSQSNAVKHKTEHGNDNPALYYQSVDEDGTNENNPGMSGMEVNDAAMRVDKARSAVDHHTVGTSGSDGPDEDWGHSRAYDRRIINTERPYYSGSIVKDEQYNTRIMPDSGPYYSSAIRK